MMGDFIAINSYELKKSKDDRFKIPVINNISLHSTYDPQREASDLIKRHYSVLSKCNKVLILGLGMGFHVQEIIRYWVEIGMHEYQIVAIEPNLRMIEDCQIYNPIKNCNFTVYFNQDPSLLFGNLSFVNFLLSGPKIIIHPPSYSIYRGYFKEVLNYKTADKISEFISLIDDEKLREYLETAFEQEQTLEDIVDSLKKDLGSRILNKDYDFLLQAYDLLRRT
ncbi:MAG: hypothetical protein HQK52_00065 [Oligoflexia bacterium]|nr:hypothetical protein [Oligoflexia bacterium]